MEITNNLSNENILKFVEGLGKSLYWLSQQCEIEKNKKENPKPNQFDNLLPPSDF